VSPLTTFAGLPKIKLLGGTFDSPGTLSSAQHGIPFHYSPFDIVAIISSQPSFLYCATGEALIL